MRHWILTLALVAVGLPAQAASITVLTDSGNIGAFTFVNAGIVAGTATINVSVPSVTSQMNTVNGNIVAPELASVNTPLTMLVTPTGGGMETVSIIPTDAVKTIGGTVGQQARLSFNLTQGITPAGLPTFFNVQGPVTHLLANADPTYDFGDFSNGLGSISLTFTATSFTGASNFGSFFTTPGAVATGNGSFSQQAFVIPEPGSIALLGVGLMVISAAARLTGSGACRG